MLTVSILDKLGSQLNVYNETKDSSTVGVLNEMHVYTVERVTP